ncbi:MAG: T9SS type A sorting domain-containing protein, partial [Bacteroidales bacterium]
GTLANAGEKTYRISRGNGSALVRILSPTAADWSTTASTAININGRILRARLTGQQSNQYLVLLWPDAADLNAISENYNTSSSIGVKVTTGGNNEYTLFQKADNESASAGDIHFNGNTLLLIENESENNLVSASLVNGDSLSYNSTTWFSADNRINFGIESISADTSELVCNFGPSSDSDTTQGVNITLGGLSANSTYYVFKKQETSSIEFTTDANGSGAFQIDLDASYKLIVTEVNINLTHLENAVTEAQEIHDTAVEGTSPGEYKEGSRAAFALEIDSAVNVMNTAVDQEEVNDAVADLIEAIEAFEASINLDLSILLELIDESDTIHDNAVEGTEEGQYEAGSKEIFKTAITEAESTAADTIATQEEIDDAVAELASALARFKAKMVPIAPLTKFSEIPYYGDFLNYSVNTKTIWEVIEENEDLIVGMNNYSTTSGQYMLINDSSFQHFEISFDARSVQGTYANDIIVVFGYQDIGNYSYIKLSSQVNESGAFTRIDGPTKFSWLFEDYETYCVQDHEWTNYKMVAFDSVITLYRNGEELFSVEPQQSLRYKGKLGVGTYYRNRAYFDDLMVTPLHSTTGMEDISGAGFSIYPNPSQDILNVEYDGGLKSVIILNMLGQKMKQFENIDNQRMNINIADLERGIYIIKLATNDDSAAMGRFVKQ